MICTLPSLRAAARGRRILWEQPAQVSPFTDTSGDRAAYDQRRVFGLKRTRQGRLRLERDHRVRFLVEGTAATPFGGRLFERLRAGFEVEASGWKAANGTAILSDEATTSFYETVAEIFAARDELRLAWLEVDGRPAALTLCLQRAGRLYALKTGFDDSLGRS